jgi:DNA-binding transcriptional MerR regulator
MSADIHDSDLLSVGQVAEQTGISPATLRIWERRYGEPEPVRLPSGHRRYTPEQVRRLRRIAEAMSRGHRAGKLLRQTDAELDELLATLTPETASPDRERVWFEMVTSFRGRELFAQLLAEGRDEDPVAFLDGVLAPFLAMVGRKWADGELDIRHEHSASQIVEDVLRHLRLEIDAAQPPVAGRPVVLTTLSGERHSLGLLMAALVLRAEAVPHHLLGVDTPVAEIVRTAEELDAPAVGISVTLASGGVDTDRILSDLRDQLAPAIGIVVGGDGSRKPRRGPRGVSYVKNLAEFRTWMRRNVPLPD